MIASKQYCSVYHAHLTARSGVTRERFITVVSCVETSGILVILPFSRHKLESAIFSRAGGEGRGVVVVGGGSGEGRGVVVVGGGEWRGKRGGGGGGGCMCA